ncbi:uncharacterized protein ATNIH1004_011699 [Aspergillus tanneri]|uniref:Uncharacterized protein n=1 Tax=Aspergillus tanneri TaxID=1220188 RepID=A0A5M9M9I0_9EURO|nr:uncharacterized protein ATNIH1004_011699 [Aspergillus tanneri]KAA8641563.1 hypothetical protein ATNIH1004_011699 [Aspergillus tanneri]
MSTIQDSTIRLNTQEDWMQWQTQFEGLARGKDIWDIISGSHAEYQLAWTIYRTKLEEYNKQKAELNKIREWIQKTVSPQVYEFCCIPSDSLNDWYDNLKKNVGVDEFRVKELAREAYQKAIKTPKPRDINTWINNWELAMQKGIKAKIAVATSLTDWIKDFLNAVRSLNPHWVESYWINKKQDIQEESLSFRMVAQDFRDSMNRMGLPQGKIAKGSFGPTFGTQDEGSDASISGTHGRDSDEDKAPAPDTRRSRKRKQRTESRGSPKEFKRNNPGSSRPAKACRACGQWHNWKDCFYLFPRKAPEGYQERSEVRRLVNLSLKDDQSFAKQVEEEIKQKAQE